MHYKNPSIDTQNKRINEKPKRTNEQIKLHSDFGATTHATRCTIIPRILRNFAAPRSSADQLLQMLESVEHQGVSLLACSLEE